MPERFRSFYLSAFRRDVQEVDQWTEEQFGLSAADRYALLIQQALRDLHVNPARAGSKARPDLAPNAYVYHLMFSRQRVAGKRVRAPRHFVVYRVTCGTIEFGRLLHDSRDFAEHLPAGFFDE